MNRQRESNAQQLLHRLNLISLLNRIPKFPSQVSDLLEVHRAEEGGNGGVTEDGLLAAGIGEEQGGVEGETKREEEGVKKRKRREE